MKIVIVGAGKIGYTLAEKLQDDNHDVVLIDNDANALMRAEEALDVLCIKGNGANISTLAEAGMADTALLVAATNSDELNMICSLLGRQLGAKHTIARIRNPEYEAEHDLLINGLGLDESINPEYAAAAEISRLLHFPWATSVESFARGKVSLIGFKIHSGDMLAGHTILDVAKRLPTRLLFCAAERGGEVFIPNGHFKIEVGDRMHVIGDTQQLTQLNKLLSKNVPKTQKVMIIGGGRIAYYLARMIDHAGIFAKIIEIDVARCGVLNDVLKNTLIINADASDQDVLEAENIGEMDAVVSLTGRDEENLLNAIFALHSGVPRAIPKVNRPSFTSLVADMGIDSIITPREIAANHILRYIRSLEKRKGSVVETLHRLIKDKLEAIEFLADGVAGIENIPLKNLPLKKEILIAALVRDGRKILIPRGDDTIVKGDNIIVVTQGIKLSHLQDILQ